MGHINKDTFLQSQIVIRKQSDFPNQTDTKIILDDATYVIDGVFLLTKEFILPDQGAVEIISSCQAINFLFYPGTGTLFTGSSRFFFLKEILIIGNNTITEFGSDATALNLTASPGGERNTVFWTDVTFAIFKDIGTIDSITTLLSFGMDLSAFGAGLKLSGIDQTILETFRLNNNISGVSSNDTAISLTDGTFDTFSFNGGSFSPLTGESVFNFDPSITMGSGIITGLAFNTNLGGTFFKSGSLSEKEPTLRFKTNGTQKDSSVLGSMFFMNNTSTTTIIRQGATVAITAFADAGGGQVTVSAIAHGLSNGEAHIIDQTTNYNGSFTASNVTANTFEITATFAGTETGSLEIGFVDIIGTAQTTSNIERFTFSDSPNELTSTGLEDVDTTLTFDVAATDGSSGIIFEFITVQDGAIVEGSFAQGQFDNRVKGISKTRTSLTILNNVYKNMVRNLETTDNIVISSYSLNIVGL